MEQRWGKPWSRAGSRMEDRFGKTVLPGGKTMIVRWSMMLMRAGRRLDARRTSGRDMALPPRERRGPRGERTPSTKEGDSGGLVVRFPARMADLSRCPELS